MNWKQYQRELNADDELAANTRRVEFHVVRDTQLPLPPVPRDLRYIASVVSGVVIAAAVVVGLIVAIVTSAK